MSHDLAITPSGHLILLKQAAGTEPAAVLSKSLVAAFAESSDHALLHLATNELQAALPPALDYVRSFARTYLTRLCQTQGHEATKNCRPRRRRPPRNWRRGSCRPRP